MKRQIATDLDDVLADMTPFIDFHNSTFNTSLTISNFTSYYLRHVLKISREEEWKRMRQFFNSPYFQQILPLEGSVEAVRYISKKYEIAVITSRPRFVRKNTEEWLGKYFPAIQKVYFTADFPREKRKKSRICLELRAETMIEDRLDYALDCSKSGIKVFLLDYPWNQISNLPPLIRRVKSWQEILREF